MKKIKVTENCRGFKNGQFTDANGQICSIQVSSAMHDERLLWLGCHELDLRVGMPWRSVSEAELAKILGATAFHENIPAINANTRMHLTQSQVKALLPLLTKFAKTGQLE